MGFFAKVRNFFKGRLDIDKVFSTVSKGLDDLNLSSQEKADSVRDFVKDTLSENTERSKARRFIAKFVMLNYFAVFWVALVAVFIEPDITRLIIEIASSFSLGYAFLAIIAFYFGGYYLGKGRKKKKQEEQ
jgi:hypothetical protein